MQHKTRGGKARDICGRTQTDYDAEDSEPMADKAPGGIAPTVSLT